MIETSGHGGATRVVGYVRVSTDDQAENGNGLDYQRRALEVWAARNRLELVTVLSDEGVSGKEEVDRRIGLPLAMGMVADGVADGIAVWKLDRLARDMVLQEYVVRELKRSGGGRLYSTFESENENLGDDGGDPSRTLVRQILGAIGQYESAMIAARMQAGKASKKRRGGYIGGFVPYGARQAGGGELEEEPAEMAVVRRMVDLRANGGSYEKIAGILNDDGVPPRRGRAWYASTVSNILKRVAPAMTADQNGKQIGVNGMGPLLPAELKLEDNGKVVVA